MGVIKFITNSSSLYPLNIGHDEKNMSLNMIFLRLQLLPALEKCFVNYQILGFDAL
jgi:hypothetical protein